jgi:hypothetical protein
LLWHLNRGEAWGVCNNLFIADAASLEGHCRGSCSCFAMLWGGGFLWFHASQITTRSWWWCLLHFWASRQTNSAIVAVHQCRPSNCGQSFSSELVRLWLDVPSFDVVISSASLALSLTFLKNMCSIHVLEKKTYKIGTMAEWRKKHRAFFCSIH